MHALLAKEFRLVVHPATYMLVVLGALVLIPSWPYAVIILYGILVAFFNAQNAREMRDLSYSFALPASRRDMVRARVLVMIIIVIVVVMMVLVLLMLCLCKKLAEFIIKCVFLSHCVNKLLTCKLVPVGRYDRSYRILLTKALYAVVKLFL